jgi:hypothetical protein
MAIALVALAAQAVPAHAANWLEMNFGLSGSRYDGVLPACEAGLTTISSNFAQKESRFWNSNLEILGFDRVQEIIARPWAENTMPRRFCSAQAHVSDGRWHPVYYSIVEGGGEIGATWGVQWCVVGLDRNWANNPACRMAQP